MENIKEINGVKYNADLVKKYEENYIMEEEGIGADPDAEPFDTQTKINEVPFEEMIEEGEVIPLEVDEND